MTLYTLALRSLRFYVITDRTGSEVWKGTNKRKALRRVRRLVKEALDKSSSAV